MSHPTWVRGLKQLVVLLLDIFCVAPYVGAWIETHFNINPLMIKLVAPYVGAWIETIKVRLKAFRRRVAPYVGAWIETLY